MGALGLDDGGVAGDGGDEVDEFLFGEVVGVFLFHGFEPFEGVV